ncbi:MAG TPA: aldehyde dehydrogenase family protein [Streptosporangiaceae bacterium]|nr:aldehyde dehydrogenase family protein [Streptosporangiaceae bacterium]
MVPETVNHFIGGQYARSTYGKTFGVADPATGKEYARVAVGLGADVNNAVRAALIAFETGPWPGLAAPERAGVLNGIADAIDARADDIASAEALGTGLPVTQAREQAAQAAEQFRRAASLVPVRHEDDAPPASGQPSSVAQRAAGVAGVITPWRTPFLAQARALASALAAGCTVVLSPDVWAPLPAALLAEITTGAGLPDAVVNVVYGTGDWRGDGDGARTDARDALVAHPHVVRLSFAGETAPGQQVMRDAVTHRKDLSAELAGDSPCIIFADADLEQATDSALFGAFSLNGQRRTASSTILAERPVYDALVSRLAMRARRIRVGDPSDPATELGALVHPEHHERVSSYVRLGMREGARLAAGGRRPAGLAEGNYLEPTVLADVTPSMRIFQEEICGPVLRVTPFDTDEEAVSLANAAKHAPAAYIWTPDLQRAHRLAQAIESVATWVNSHNARDLQPSSGGAGEEDGPGRIDFYTRSRTVHVAADDRPVPRLGA